jgi:hypothetical protein
MRGKNETRICHRWPDRSRQFHRGRQVNIQADAPFRDQPTDIDNIYVRNAQGAMVPIAALAQERLVQGPQAVVRYNGYRAAVVNGAPKPGFSSGAERLDLSGLCRGDQPVLQLLRMAGLGFPDHHVFWEGEALAGVDRGRRGDAQRLRRRPARQRQHLSHALRQRRFERAVGDSRQASPVAYLFRFRASPRPY